MEPLREQILNLQHISYTYHTLQGETLALSDISFSLKKGEFAAIVGPSGCGKSTLLFADLRTAALYRGAD